MKRTNAVTRAVLGLLAMALAISSPALAQKNETRPVRVYVFTAASEGGFVDADSKGRADSVRDILGLLKKKKSMMMIDNRDNAEVVLEITRRGWELADGKFLGEKPIYGDSKVSQECVVRATLTVGEYSTEIVGRGGHTGMTWRIAAGKVAGEVERWIKDNAARIPRK